MFEIHPIPVTFPEKDIFLRLNGNLTKTELSTDEKILYLHTAKEAFELCCPTGRWDFFQVKNVSETGITLADGFFIPGRDFAAKCGKISHLWCGAVTVGEDVADAEKESSSVFIRAIYDAVASETADGAMDYLTRIARKNLLRMGLNMDERRYSPGYGDMPLALQEFFFSRLNLDGMKMSLNDDFYMFPEKSVTAFAGIRSIGE